MAARSDRKRARGRSEACRLRGRGRGFRRRPLDSHGRHRRSRARRCALSRALYALSLATRSHFCGKNPFCDAQRFRRACRTQRPQGQAVMTPKTGATTARPADPCCLVIVGVARSPSSSEAFREDLANSLPQFAGRPIDQKVLKQVLDCVAYVQGDPDDDSTYTKIGQELARIERDRATRGNRLFYLATPPAGFAPIGCHLGQSGLALENGADN